MITCNNKYCVNDLCLVHMTEEEMERARRYCSQVENCDYSEELILKTCPYAQIIGEMED